MNLGSFATVALIALSVGLLGGCGGGNIRPWDVGDKPQVLLPGAVRSDVKGLAMGAARSKGWTIVSSSEDKIVMQRPLDPASPTAQALTATGSTVPQMVEVTSAFVEQSDGVLVALGAELVTQPPGAKEPERIDYTQTYRDALTQSLESLRSNWSSNSARIGNAVPSEESHAEAVAAIASDSKSDNPLVRAWGDAAQEQSSSGAESETAQANLDSTAATAPPTPSPEPVAEPRQNSATSATTYSEPPQDTSVPESTPRPAPVVEGSSVVSRTNPAPRSPAQPALLPPAPVESVSPSENMLSLNQASGTGTWAYYAEQYARLRGCSLTDTGSILIETRSDGEIHKVPCAGSDSYLLKCQNGVCRGLQ